MFSHGGKDLYNIGVASGAALCTAHAHADFAHPINIKHGSFPFFFILVAIHERHSTRYIPAILKLKSGHPLNWCKCISENINNYKNCNTKENNLPLKVNDRNYVRMWQLSTLKGQKLCSVQQAPPFKGTVGEGVFFHGFTLYEAQIWKLKRFRFLFRILRNYPNLSLIPRCVLQ
jgi:hypothetical protein